ncbi:MAG: RIP metalloprotease RseP [Gemmatimonadetes bacterium]|nr:MAG: RIP metalloprotease RseP [Gemmatimonadota bacterium]
MLLTIVSLIVVLGVLISVHEFGHFIVAKAVGIQVLRFSLGFGRPVIQWRRGETEYWISWIPLGGYVKMAGLEDEGMVGELEGGKADVAIDPARAFDRQPLWARMAVILAGVTMNLFLAFVIYTGLIAVAGVPRAAMIPIDSVDVASLPRGADALASLRRGDRIVRLNGDSLKAWDDLEEKILAGREALRFEVAGRAEPIVIHVPRDPTTREKLARAFVPLFPARIGQVILGQPAQRAGLRGWDEVVKIDDDTVVSWADLVRRVRASPGRALALTVLRDDSIMKVSVTPAPQDSGGQHFGLIGAGPNPPVVRVPVGFGAALSIGVRQTGLQIVSVVTQVKRLVTGQASARELGGPISIAQMSGQAARLGFDWFLQFLAFFSVSLAVLNLLPIPVLDGGHAMFLIAEAIRRRPLSPQLRLRLTQVGMLVVLAIMVIALSNDVLRLFR